MERLKLIRDCIEINIPPALYLGALTLAEVQAITAIALGVVSMICTILITRAKLAKPKKDED